MTIDLSSLQVIDAIERKGSFAAAAKELERVPSAITYVVRKLEDELGILLFDRSGHRARLTAAGQELLNEGRTLLQGADALERRVQRVASGWEVELRIAVDGRLRDDAVLCLVANFLKDAPPTRIRLSSEVLGGTWDALLAGRADLGLGGAEAPPGGSDSPGFKSRELGYIEMVFVVAPDHPLAPVDIPLTAAMIRGHRAIAVADTSRSLPAMTIGLLHGQDVLTLPTLEHKISALMRGLGCGYVPRSLINRQLEAKTLVLKATSEPVRRGMSHYQWNAEAEGNAMRWFLQQLADPVVRFELVS
jgi:DNA-binding transcriptional LysR family regulator